MKAYTTGQCAKMCQVSMRTVVKWFDSGMLLGYRIPGSQDRRIPQSYLIKFIQKHGMPMPEELKKAVAAEEAADVKKWLIR